MDIIEFNNLPSTVLSVGQKVLIPGMSTENIPSEKGQYYVVKSGDNLYDIASRFGTTVNDIVSANNLSSTVLSIGQQLYIPTGVVVEEPSNTVIYTVKRGDSLYSIARNYGLTIDEIKRINSLNSDILTIGQVLTLPANNTKTNYSNYTVVAGDSLYSIAARFNTTIDNIKELNGLTSNLLTIGQVLTIPS